MKVLTLKLNDKTYATGKITAFLSKEALKIQKDALTLAKAGKDVQNDTENLEAVDNLLSSLLEVRERKNWLICEVYGNKFTADDIEKNLDDAEIDAEINRIISGIYGVVAKN